MYKGQASSVQPFSVQRLGGPVVVTGGGAELAQTRSGDMLAQKTKSDVPNEAI